MAPLQRFASVHGRHRNRANKKPAATPPKSHRNRTCDPQAPLSDCNAGCAIDPSCYGDDVGVTAASPHALFARHGVRVDRNLNSFDRPDTPAGVAIDQLDVLVGDFAAHIRRLAELDVDGVTNADVLAELRDNAYPSLLILAEAMRELDAELAELSAPEPTLTPEHALAITAALRCGQTLVTAVRSAASEISSKASRETLEARTSDFEAASRLATAILHGLVVVDDQLEPEVEDAR